MRYEDASQISGDVVARDDTEHLAGNDFGPATGNLITGVDTVSGATGTDSGGQITAIAGAGGSDTTFDADGKLEVAGQYGTLTIDAAGNYTYVRNPDSPEGVSDTFTYTLANEAGATDTAQLVIAIGNPPILQAEGTPTVLPNQNVVILPPGVELSDVRVVGRDLVITLPDGSTMVIPDGAIFVPQLVVNGVEVPASNLAALLIDAEPKPAAGDASPNQLSSGGNFALPPGPLDPGVPLGDLLPPTELTFTPPEVDEIFDAIENDPPVITPSAINVSDEGVSSVDVPLPDNAGSPDTTNSRIVNGHITVVDDDGDPVTITLGAPTDALTSQGVAITWSVSPDGHTVIGSAGGTEVIRIEIADNGDYTVTQSRPVDHPNTSIEDGVSFVVPVFATDGEDAAVPSTITVTIEDDSPVIEGRIGEPVLTVDDTTFNVNDTDGIGGAFAAFFGADGEHATNPISYAMGINAGATGLFDTLTGEQVVLTLESGVVVGRAGAGGPIVFTVSVDGSGNVTLDQSRAVVHNDPADPIETGGSAATLAADNLVTVSIVATDFDGDQDSITIDIGQNLFFEDDGPSIERNQNAVPGLVTDDTDTPGATDGPVSFAGLFTGVFGNDGPKDSDDNDIADADAISFSLSINGGNGTASGLFDVLTGDSILLRVNGDGDIEGYLAGDDTVVAFTIDLDANGDISLIQDRAITHDDPTDPIESGADAEGMAANLIVLTATITDGDGDTDTATADIGDAFSFEDDGPSITRNSNTVPQLVTDDTDTPNATDGPVSFAALFDSSFGKDGPKDADDNDIADDDAIAYSLSINGGDGTASGLFDVLSGDSILLRVDGDTIEGYLAGSPATVAFTITLDPATGEISLEQDRAITHDDPTDPIESGGDAEGMAANLIVLTATITDGDGDTDTATADIGDAFAFEDDGPSIERNGQTAPTLVTDDTDTPDATDGPVSFAGLFTADFGADGPKDSDDNDIADDDAIAYSLSITGGDGTASGLFDVLSGDSILLRVDGDTIEGYLAGSPATVAFTITLDPATGEISLEQDRAITHDDPTDPIESGGDAEGMAANLIVLTATITDGDGDTDTATADIGDAFAFEDDGPSITRNEESAPDLFTDDTDIPDTANAVSFAGLFDEDFGADGPKDADDNDVADDDAVAYSLSINGGDGTASGLFDVVTGDSILLRVDGDTIEGYLAGDDTVVAFVLTLDPDTGTISQQQLRAITHDDPLDPIEDGADAETMAADLIVLTATITDGDGDTDTATANIGDSFHFEDDGPTAVDDVDSVGAPGDTATGNVITDAEGDGGEDDVGADTPGTVTDVVSENEPGNSDTDPDPNVFEIQGEFGVLVMNANGSYTYTRDLGSPGGGQDVFTYTLTDADGDSDTATLTINIADAVPVAGTESATVDDDGLVGSPDGVLEAGINDINANLGETPATNNNEAIFNGTLNATGGDGALTFSLLEPTDGATIGQETVNYTLVGNLLTATIATSPDGTRVGDTLFTVNLVNAATGDYVVTLVDNVLHGNDANDDEDGIEVQVVVEYQVEDSDGSTSAANGQLTISFNDDIPSAAVSVAGLSISHDETPGVDGDADDDALAHPEFAGVLNPGDDPDVTPNPIGFATSTGAVAATGTDFGADGGTAAFSLTISNLAGTDSGLNVTGGQDIILFVENGLVVGRVSGGPLDGKAAFAIAIDSSTGVITMVQYLSIQHTNTASLDESTSILNAAVSAVVTATDADGDVDTAQTPIGSLISFQDDGPTTYEPANGSVTNANVAPVSFNLDAAPGNGDIGDNFGADGPGFVRFPSSLNATDSGETSGGVKIWYFLNGDQTVLTARTGADATAAASGTIVFTITLDQANDQYTVDMNGTVDNLGEINFDDTLFDFVGGNETWFGIVPNNQGPDDTPVDDESQDLLITPTNETTVNTSGILGGIDTGQSVGTGEGFRIDYVIDLTGEPAGGGADYQNGVDNGHFLNVEPGDVPSHYTTNGAFFTIRQSDGSDILIKAFDDTDNDNVVGDGTQDTINKIVITYTNDLGVEFVSADLIPTTTEQFVTLDGVQFSYELDDDLKSVHIGNVQGATGANENPNTQIAVFTGNGYNSLEVYWEGGETFKFAGFGILSQSLEPVELSFPTEIVDGDGDVVAGGDIDLTLTPQAPPPLVLDMDGDGAEFLGLDAGVAYNYGAGLVGTAWVGSDDAILVRDANGNGLVDDASEFVFGGNGQTDMEALHAQYGDQLDASDADFTMFAAWTDANSNGAVDAGELQSLAEAGITSIGLVSDGIAYTAANGDVSVAGTASYTRADGSTGDVADASFATGGARSTQEVERVAANSNSVMLAAAVAAAGMAASSAAAEAPSFGGGDQFVTNALVGREAFSDLGSVQIDDSSFSSLSAWQDSGFDFGAMTMASSSHTAIAASHIGELTTSLSLGSGPNALLEATEFGSMLQMPAPAAGMELAMPSLELLQQAAGVEAQATQEVAQIIADALNGGGAATDINALLNALPGGQGLGEIAGLGGLASGAGGMVPTWDMGHGGVFTFDAMSIITSEAMVLHHDAVQPVANG